jgi:pimeloyl-ACP methyl ester carboxylesterase
MTETPFYFGAGGLLFGILANSAPEAVSVRKKVAIIFLNAGNLSHVGPNRMYVRYARELAMRGFPSLRMDFSGIGDSISLPRMSNWTPMERGLGEIREAMDALESSLIADEFILIGLCSGADFALAAALSNANIKGVILINGRFVSPGTYAVMRHRITICAIKRFRKMKTFQLSAWIKFAKERIERYRKTNNTCDPSIEMEGTSRPLQIEVDQDAKVWRDLKEKKIPAFLIFSEGSLNLDLFQLFHEPSFYNARNLETMQLKIVKRADHTFTQLSSQFLLKEMIVKWCENLNVTH